MDIVKTFGKKVDELTETNPERARLLLKTGWAAQQMMLKALPNRKLLPADQYLARMMMSMMRKPLQNPQNAAAVSIFTPCEMLQEAGLHPYNVEAFSSYLCGSMAESAFIQHAESTGLPETLCSFHKVFIGAAQQGLLPKPRCIVYTNLVCDANLVTFRHLAEIWKIPSFQLDIPLQPTDANVRYVAFQLCDLAAFLEKTTGKRMDERALTVRLERSKRTLENFERAQKIRSERCVPVDLATPLYTAISNNLLLGTEEEERYTQLLLKDVSCAPPSKGIRLYWMHILPFWSQAANDALRLTERAQIITCDLAQACPSDFDPSAPYEAMAKRMVYHHFNGGILRRIEQGIQHAKQAGADGGVWFDHWGCKHTLGGAQLAKKKFEEAGIPLLILDGDGCDRSHGGEGQTATRLGAFLEMLEGDAHE